MKIIHCLFIIVLFHASQLNAQNNKIQEVKVENRSLDKSASGGDLLDSNYSWRWDTTLNSWYTTYAATYIYNANDKLVNQFIRRDVNKKLMNYAKDTRTYNNDNLVSEAIREQWDGSSWKNQNRYTYTYNNILQMEKLVIEKWSGNSWHNDYQYTYSYDSQGNQTDYLSQSWLGTWINETQGKYIYDNNNNQVSARYYDWNGVWVEDWLDSMAYGTNNKVVFHLFAFNSGLGLENYSRRLTTYTQIGNEFFASEVILDLWKNSNWEKGSKFAYSYDVNGNRIESKRLVWTSAAYENYERSNFTYDSQDLLVQRYDEKYDKAIPEWLPRTVWDYTYDNNQNNVTERIQNWISSSWQNVDTAHWYYTLNPQSITEENSLPSLQVFPNPAEDIAHFVFNDPPSSLGRTLLLFDLNGRLVFQASNLFDQQFIVDCSSIKPGTYIYKVQELNQITASGKLVVQRE